MGGGGSWLPACSPGTGPLSQWAPGASTAAHRHAGHHDLLCAPQLGQAPGRDPAQTRPSVVAYSSWPRFPRKKCLFLWPFILAPDEFILPCLPAHVNLLTRFEMAAKVWDGSTCHSSPTLPTPSKGTRIRARSEWWGAQGSEEPGYKSMSRPRASSAPWRQGDPGGIQRKGASLREDSKGGWRTPLGLPHKEDIMGLGQCRIHFVLLPQSYFFYINIHSPHWKSANSGTPVMTELLPPASVSTHI